MDKRFYLEPSFFINIGSRQKWRYCRPCMMPKTLAPMRKDHPSTMKQSTTDLFGTNQEVKRRIPRLEKGLRNYDTATFDERLKRLKLIEKIYPKGLLIGGDMEFVYTFRETKECYVSGHFIATMILAQSFIEKLFHQYFESKGLETTAKKGLDQMIKYARRNNLINSLILDKVDALRLKRNPFTHSKNWDYPHTISKRMVKGQTIIQPEKLLENDATEAIQVMLLLTTYKL